jgi:hypothetical protein
MTSFKLTVQDCKSHAQTPKQLSNLFCLPSIHNEVAGSTAHVRMISPLVTGLHFEGFAPERPQSEIWGRYLQINHTPERSAGRDQIKGRPNNKFLLKQIVLDLTGRSSGFEPAVGLSITSPPPTSDCCQEMAGSKRIAWHRAKANLVCPWKECYLENYI